MRFERGHRIYLPGGVGEPRALAGQVLGATDLDIVTTFLPGVNAIDATMIGSGTRLTGLFMLPALSSAQRDGTFRHLPISYSAMSTAVRTGPPFDACVVQVSPPDPAGFCSLGLAAEFTPMVLDRSVRVVGLLNRQAPFLLNSPKIHLSRLHETIECDGPLVEYSVEGDAVSSAIGELIIETVPDGAVLQLGLGKVPNALAGALAKKRGLRLHSGMLSDGVMHIHEAGALDSGWSHLTTTLLGSAALYRWAEHCGFLTIAGCEVTHDPVRLAGLDTFIAINSALEVDLFGQCNLELIGGKAVSGPGGAPDFAHAAARSENGLSIVALPATSGSKGISRIVSKLGPDSVASLPRTDVDMIVTEFGRADLRGLSTFERADALIAIASPEAREGLRQAWGNIASSL